MPNGLGREVSCLTSRCKWELSYSSMIHTIYLRIMASYYVRLTDNENVHNGIQETKHRSSGDTITEIRENVFHKYILLFNRKRF